MQVENTFIDGLKIITPAVFEDDRGWFYESFSSKNFDIGFVQDNHSKSLKAGILRGLHFQNEPMAQTKLVRCTRGAVLDVAVDLRSNSPTYKKWFSVELSEKNKKQLLIPKGLAHGFLTLVDNTEIQYKVDNYYSKEHDCSIIYNDTDINIDWGLLGEPILSEKDKNAPLLSEVLL